MYALGTRLTVFLNCFAVWGGAGTTGPGPLATTAVVLPFFLASLVTVGPFYYQEFSYDQLLVCGVTDLDQP